MKKAGIIGGMGPVSTLDYYRGIVEGFRAGRNDNRYPELIIDSVNMTEMLSYAGAKNWNGLVDFLAASLKNLAGGGAEFAAMASNTPHIVFEQLESKSPLPMISIVEETCKYAATRGYRNSIVLGTIFTMSNNLYPQAFAKYHMGTVPLTLQEQQTVHGIIFPKLEDGIVDPADKETLLSLIERLIRTHGADALVLGCTELPLMIQPGDLNIPVLDTVKIHIDAIVRQMLS